MKTLIYRVASRIILILIALVSSSCTTLGEDTRLDVLIEHGLVYSGADEAPIRAAVGIRDDRIVYVGAAERRFSAKRRINARGLIVAPGFIDPHTHSLAELESADRNGNVNYLMQGVTTVFNGNDGEGPIKVAAALKRLQAGGIGTNTALFVGHNTVRKAVLGLQDRAPDQHEMEAMQRMIATAMQEGALGLSTGLYYAPGSFATTEEVIALAKIAARQGGVYESHIRDESSYSVGMLSAIEEALRIGREADIAVHIAHIKALGVDVWGSSRKAIDLIEAAQKQGQVVTADQYPWRASGTHLRNALMPRWAMAGSSDKFRQRLKDPQLLPRIKTAMRENLRRRGGADSLLILKATDAKLAGKTLQQVAAEQGGDPIDVAINIVLSGSTRVASFNMNSRDIENFMRQKWVMTSSDGTDGHPRKFASFPKKFRDYVVNKPLLTVQSFINRSSAMVAESFGIADRGYIKSGYYADVVVFDRNSFVPRASFENWQRLSEGIVYALVNGRLAVDEGRYTGALAGRPLKLDRVGSERQ